MVNCYYDLNFIFKKKKIQNAFYKQHGQVLMLQYKNLYYSYSDIANTQKKTRQVASVVVGLVEDLQLFVCKVCELLK